MIKINRFKPSLKLLGKVVIGSFIINGFSISTSQAQTIWGRFRPETLTQYRGSVYFSTSTSLGAGLWKTDGTKAGTVLIKNFEGGENRYSQSNFTRFNSRLYFTACNAQSGCEIWQSDGTQAGTKLLKDINPGAKGANFTPLARLNGKLYFRACTTSSGCEIWTTDGTSQGTSLLKDINPGAGDVSDVSRGRSFAFALKDRVLFPVCLPEKNCQLWGTDGTETGTKFIREVDFSSSEPVATRWGDDLYFIGCQIKETTNDCGLWKTNGTIQGTVLVKNFPSQGLVTTNSFTRYGKNLYFSASNSNKGTELWKTDGTTSGTVLVKDINPGIDDSFPEGFININGKLCFRAKDLVSGYELRRTNGTASGTVLVKDINPGSIDSFPTFVAIFRGSLLFGATTPQGEQLWKTDCTPQGSSAIANIGTSSSIYSDPKDALAINDSLYLVAKSSQVKRGLWKTDGTTNGTVLLKALKYDSQGFGDGYAIDDLTRVNETLLFSVVYRVTSGGPFYELWKSDGTPEGTAKIYP
jgi:trimeric autotransporter adhesin